MGTQKRDSTKTAQLRRETFTTDVHPSHVHGLYLGHAGCMYGTSLSRWDLGDVRVLVARGGGQALLAPAEWPRASRPSGPQPPGVRSPGWHHVVE